MGIKRKTLLLVAVLAISVVLAVGEVQEQGEQLAVDVEKSAFVQLESENENQLEIKNQSAATSTTSDQSDMSDQAGVDDGQETGSAEETEDEEEEDSSSSEEKEQIDKSLAAKVAHEEQTAAWEDQARNDQFLSRAQQKGRKFEAREFKETTSAHLNQALDFDPYVLVASGECPANWEILQAKAWLDAWTDLFHKTDLLEGDIEILKSVRALIFDTRQNIMVAGTMPLEFAESMKKLKKQQANYIQIIYGKEMAEVFSKVKNMESSTDLNDTLDMCDDILHSIDRLLTDLSAVLGMKKDYAEFVHILKTLNGVLDQIKEDCDAVAADDSESEDEEYEEETIIGEDGKEVVVRKKKARRAYKQNEDRWMDESEDQLFVDQVDEETGEVTRRRRKRGEKPQEITKDAVQSSQSDKGTKFEGQEDEEEGTPAQQKSKRGDLQWDTDGDGKVEEQKIDKKLIRRINQVGMAMFFRWSVALPKYLEEWNVFHVNKQCQQVARVFQTTEENKGQDIGATDRILAVHLCPSEDGEGNLALRFSGTDEVTNDYDLHFNVDTTYEELESSWVWFYFGYSEKLKKQILATHFLQTDRWVVHEFDNVQKRKFIHIKNFEFVVGSSHGWDAINAIFSQPKLEVIRDDFHGTEEDIKKYFEANFKVPSFGELRKPGEMDLKDVEEIKDADNQVNLVSFGKKFEGAIDYAVHGWFLFDEPRVNEDEHTVYWFTQNNPTTGKFKAGEAWGDVALTFSVGRQTLKFCTYTFGANGRDAGSKRTCISHYMGIPRASMWWAYSYFAYSRQHQKVMLYLKFEGKNYRYEERAIHFTPTWTGMYYLKDSVNKGGFEGSTKRFQFVAGPGAFIQSDQDVQKIAGVSPEPANEEVPEDQLPTGKKYQLTIGADKPAFRLDLPKGTARLGTEFRIETWVKLSLSNPERIVDTDKFFTKGCRHIIRAYEGVYLDEENGKKDRFMAIFFCAGGDYQYRFFTSYENVRDDQDLNGYSIPMKFPQIEGVWNYVYMGFDQKLKAAIAGVYSSYDDTIRTLGIQASRERGKVTRIGFLIGAGFGLGTINGRLEQASTRWDDDAYMSNEKMIREHLDGENVEPADEWLNHQLRFRLIGDGEEIFEYKPVGIPVEFIEEVEGSESDDGEQDGESDGAAHHAEEEEEEEQVEVKSPLSHDGEEGEDTGQEAYFDGEGDEDLYLFRDIQDQGSDATEWAVHGWYKFEDEEHQYMEGGEKLITILRLVFNDDRKKDLTNNLHVGDQVLSLTINNNGNLQLCTGNNMYSLRDRPNPSECLSAPYENDLFSWTWFHLSYSRKEEKIRFYIQYEDHPWEGMISDVVHFIPHWSGVYLGGDPFTSEHRFIGTMREFELLYGARSFSTGNLDHLIEANPPHEVVQMMRNAVAGGLWGVLKESEARADAPVYLVEVPPNLLDDVYSVSFSFWFRYSTQIPQKITDLSYLREEGKPVMLARVVDCELGDFDGKTKERFMAVYIEDGLIQFGAFDQNEQELRVADGEIPFSELEGTWNWVYMGLNLQTGKVLGTQYNMDNKIWEFIEIEQVFKDDPLSYLKFVVGRSFDVETINGHFFDFRFDFLKGSLKETKADIRKFFRNQVPVPTAFQGSDELINKEVLAEKEKEFKSDYASQNVVASDFSDDMAHNKEYAVYGWFQFKEPQIRKDMHTIFRLTGNVEDTNFDYPGDATLALYITPHNLEFVTYSINNDWKGKDNAHVAIQVDFDNDLYAWIFFYFSYDRNQNAYNLYVRFQDRNERLMGTVVHFVPKTFRFYLGEDGHNDPFSGTIRAIHVLAGPGAFNSGDLREITMSQAPEEVLAALNAAQGADLEKQYVATTLLSRKSVYTLDIPPELIEENQEYSFAFWTKLSLTYPNRLFEYNWMTSNEELILGRFTNLEIDEDESGDKKERFAALILQNGKYKLQAYNDADGTLKEEIAAEKSVKQVEGAWVWSVVSYSTESQGVNLGLYFPEEDEWVISTVEVEKNLPLNIMKFIVGPSYGLRSIHGQFFDARFEFEYYADEAAIKKFFEEEVNKPNYYRVGGDQSFTVEDGELIYDILKNDAFFDNSLDRQATANDLKTKYFDARHYSVRGWFKWSEPDEDSHADWYNLFRLTINSFDKEENKDHALVGDRVLGLWLNKNGNLHFTTYSIADDWSGQGTSNLTKDEETSNDLFSWIFVYFGYSFAESKAVYHIRFEDHVQTGEFDDVHHLIPFWLGFYLGDDPIYQGFNGKMSMFSVNFGPKAWTTGKWRTIYDPRPPEMVRDLSGLNGNDLVGRYESTPAESQEPVVYGLDLPPELLEDVVEYQITFWFRHSQNFPKENPKWDEPFKKCHNILRIRETEDGDAQEVGDRSAHLMICPKDGGLVLRAATYDLESNNANLYTEQKILFSELEGTWLWIYCGFSKSENKLSVMVKVPRTERNIFIEIPAVHTEHTEKIRLDLGWDGYVMPLQGTFFDVDFSWGNDGEFYGTEADIEAFYERLHKEPEQNVWASGDKSLNHNILDDWDINTATQSENVHHSFNTQYDNADQYAVYGWHKWSHLPGKSSWYLLYRLHTNQNPSNVAQLGDRAISLWIGDNVYHPATYHTADEKLAANPNVVPLFNYDQWDINSWMFTYASYSRTQKTYYFYSWCHGKETNIKLENIVHFVPGYFGFYIGKDPWHRSFHGRMRNYRLVFGPGAYRAADFNALRGAKTENQGKPRQTIADTMFTTHHGKEETHYLHEIDPEDLGDIKEFGFSLYFRWGQRLPEYIRDPYYYLSQCFVIARFSETYGNDGQPGDRSLALWLCPHNRNPGLYFATYDSVAGTTSLGKHLPYDFSDLDGSWNFFYLAWSKESSKFIFYAKFERTGKEIYEEIGNARHLDPNGSLKFILGNDGFYKSAPGFYYSVNYGINKGIFVDGKEAVLKYAKAQSQPPKLAAPPSQHVITDEMAFAYTEPDVEITEFPEAASGAMDYAAYGHFKWATGGGRPDWCLLFRFSTTLPAFYHNANTLGDRDLSVWVHNSNFLHFTTYDFDSSSNVNRVHNVPFDWAEFADKWFFIYYGYSIAKGQAYYYIRFESGKVLEGSFLARHFVPSFAMFRLAKDEWHYAWNGETKYIQVAFGEGSYREKDFDELRNMKPKFGADEDEYQGKPEFSAGGKDPIETNNEGPRDQPLIEHKFDMSLLDQVDYSWSTYYKHSWRTPGHLDLGTARGNWYQIGGITLDEGDFRWPPQMGWRTLAMWIWPMAHGSGFHFVTYDQQTGNTNDVQNQFITMDEFELGWNWFYFGYSSRKQRAFAFIHLGLTGQVYTLSWPGRQHFKTPKPLKFYIGCTPQWFPANGHYFDVRVDYGKGSFFGSADDVLAYKDKFVPKPPLMYQQKKHQDELIDKEGVWVGRTQSLDDLQAERRWKFGGGALEYAVHGWFRWVDWKPDTWNNLFRVTYQPERFQNNAHYIGDRDLCVWVGPGYLHYTTSTYQVNGGDNWNVVQNIDFQNSIASGEWVFVYFGYDRTKHSASGYVKFADREANVKFDNIRHQVAGEMWVYLGRDLYHAGINGVMRNWNYVSGPGAYRTEAFEQLYNPTVDLEPAVTEQFVQPDFIGEQYTQTELHHQQNMRVEAPKSDLPQDYDIAYSFYYKFKWLPGTTDMGRLRGWWHCFAGFTERGSYAGAGWHERTLSIFFIYWAHSVGFHTTLYDFNCNRDCGNYWKNVEGLVMPTIQNSWTQVYFGYSHQKRSAFIYFHFEATGETRTLEWTGIVQQKQKDQLQFILGGLPHQYHPAPGYYRDVRVYWKSQGAFLSNAKSVENYFAKATKAPSGPRELPFKEYMIVDDKIVSVGVNDGARRFVEQSANDGAEEYAWSGWFRWEEIGRHAWHIMVRVCNLENHIDASYFGDRSLNLWLNPNGQFLHFATYNVHHRSGDNVNFWQNIGATNENYAQWFFVYFGYSYKELKAYARVVFSDQTVAELEWGNVHHLLPVYSTWYLAKDPWYGGFNGQVRKFRMMYGKGSYRRSDEGLNELMVFSKSGSFPKATFDQEEYGPNKLYENDRPLIDLKFDEMDDHNVTEYSFSFYYKPTLGVPDLMNLGNLRGTWRALAGISENGDMAPAGRPGDRTLSIWDRYWNDHPGLHVTTYGQNHGNWNMWKNLNLDWVKEYDNQWTFIYFGYSCSEKRAFFYQKFLRNDRVQVLEWNDITHYNPMLRAFFQVGRTSSYKWGIQAYFGQVKLNFETGKAFLTNADLVEKYRTDQFKTPDNTGTPYQEIVLQESEKENLRTKRFDMKYDDENGFRVPAPGGANEFAVSGWFKGVRNSQYQVNIIRVTYNANYDNAYFEDRSLNLWLYSPTGAFTLVTSRIYPDDWNWMYGKSTYEEWDDISEWFWVYIGYSALQRKSIMFIRFHDHEAKLIYANVHKYVPHELFIIPANCKHYEGFTGFYQDITVYLGNGAFRENNFDELHKSPISAKTLSDADVVYGMPQELYEISAPLDALADIKEYSFSFYFRFTYIIKENRFHPGWARGQWLGLAGITETKDYSGVAWGQRTLAIWNWPWSSRSGYHFTTYNYPHNANHHQEIDYDHNFEYDGSWNFVYFGYSSIDKRVYAFVKFGATGRVATLNWNNINHFVPPQDLQFIVGRPAGYNSLHGSFAAIQWSYEKGAFIGDENLILNSYIPNNNGPKGRFFLQKTIVKNLQGGQMIEATRTEPYDQSRNSDHDATGALERAWYGWAKWLPGPKDTWNLIGRLTTQESAGNADWWGDRTLTVWAGPGYLHFTTYQFFQNSGDNFNRVENINYGDQLTNWFFIYFSYNHIKQQVRAFARFRDNREQEINFGRINHMLNDNIHFQLAQDKWYAAFNGQMNDFNLVLGPGAALSGLPSYLPVMYRDNPRSIRVEGLTRSTLLLTELDSSDQQYACESCQTNYFESDQYLKFFDLSTSSSDSTTPLNNQSNSQMKVQESDPKSSRRF